MATAVATTSNEPRELTTAQLPALITTSAKARALIAPFLPPGVSLDRVASSLRLALAKDRATAKTSPSPLERCDPTSVFMAVAKIQQWGLEIGETAHLVPFGVECVPVADYKGLAEQVIAAGVARAVEAHCIYEKESFRLKRGTTTEIEHHPIADPKARGKMVAAYALFHLRGGIILVEYMAVDDIDAIRQKYSKQWKGGALPDWYAKKTVVRRGVKLLPKNPRLAERLAEMDREIAEVPADLAAAMVQPVDGEEPAQVHRIEDARKPLITDGSHPYDGGAAPIPPAQHADEDHPSEEQLRL